MAERLPSVHVRLHPTLFLCPAATLRFVCNTCCPRHTRPPAHCLDMSGGHRAEFARLLVLSFDRRSHVTEDNVRKRHCAVDFFSDSAPSPSAEEQVRPACCLRLAPDCAQRQQLEESADDSALAAHAIPRWILHGRADLKWRAPFASIAFLRSQPLALGPFSCLRSWHLELNIFEHRSVRVGRSDPGAP